MLLPLKLIPPLKLTFVNVVPVKSAFEKSIFEIVNVEPLSGVKVALVRFVPMNDQPSPTLIELVVLSVCPVKS